MTTKRAFVLFVTLIAISGAFYLLAASSNTGVSQTNGSAPPTADSASKIIAYYFHVTARCTTCRTIEAYSHEAITKNFKNDMDRGRLEWHVVNVQLPENKHFVKDYQLFTKSVVLVRIAGGKQQSYKILNDVWQLTGDKARFQSYIDKEVRAYLAKL